MVTAQALAHGDVERLLGFSEFEHPVALQVGGSDPALLARAARLGEQYGYDEINLNVGCPSERVQSGSFGACLMAEPALVADCMTAMREAVRIPVTVKCRIGIDDRDDYAFFEDFVLTVRDGRRRRVHRACAQGAPEGAQPEREPRDSATAVRRAGATEGASIPNSRSILNGGLKTAGAGARVAASVRWRDAGPPGVPGAVPAGGTGRRAARAGLRAAAARAGRGAATRTMSSACWGRAIGCR